MLHLLKVNLLVCYSLPIIFVFPFYFGIQVVKLPVYDSPVTAITTATNQGYWTMTHFGDKKLFQVYLLAILLVESLIPTLLLIIFNIISLIKFKLVVKKNVITPDSLLRRVELQLVRLVLILTFIIIFTRLFDSITAFASRFIIIWDIQVSNEVDALKRLLKQVAYIFLFAAHALDGFFYLFYDRQLKRAVYDLVNKTRTKFISKMTLLFNDFFYNYV